MDNAMPRLAGAAVAASLEATCAILIDDVRQEHESRVDQRS